MDVTMGYVIGSRYICDSGLN